MATRLADSFRTADLADIAILETAPQEEMLVRA